LPPPPHGRMGGMANAQPITSVWLRPWRWPWWAWVLFFPVAFAGYGFSGGVIFYFLHRCNITGPVFDMCVIGFWPIQWLRFNFPFGNEIGKWWWETLCWLFGKPNK